MRIGQTCSACGATIKISDVSPDSLTTKTVTAPDGVELTVTYHTCTWCQKDGIVQIDNEETLDLLAQYKQALTRLSILRARKQKNVILFEKKVETLGNRLSYNRQVINSEYWRALNPVKEN